MPTEATYMELGMEVTETGLWHGAGHDEMCHDEQCTHPVRCYVCEKVARLWNDHEDDRPWNESVYLCEDCDR